MGHLAKVIRLIDNEKVTCDEVAAQFQDAKSELICLDPCGETVRSEDFGDFEMFGRTFVTGTAEQIERRRRQSTATDVTAVTNPPHPIHEDQPETLRAGTHTSANDEQSRPATPLRKPVILARSISTLLKINFHFVSI